MLSTLIYLFPSLYGEGYDLITLLLNGTGQSEWDMAMNRSLFYGSEHLLVYLFLVSLMKDIRRTFMYHGAEHKCINCIERGRELNVENVRKSSRQHRRCGTSFLLFVVFVSAVLFFFIRVESPIWRVALRILLIPVIAGIAYEIIRLAGKSDNILVRILSACFCRS